MRESRTLVAVVLLVIGSVASVAFDLPLVVAMLTLVPGLLALSPSRRSEYHLSWSEALAAVVPVGVVFIGAYFVFDLSGDGWMAVFVTAMVVSLLIVRWQRGDAGSRTPPAEGR